MTATKRKIYVDLAVGLIVVGLLIFVKVQFVEGTFIGNWFNAKGYEVLHRIIPSFNRQKEPSVVVLDISDLEREPDGTTPKKRLREIVEALIESQAKAIAIDIDFSPRPDFQTGDLAGTRTEENEEFFKFLHEHKQKPNGVPVFVGVHNVGVEPKTWLGLEDYKDLAADMTLFDDNTTEVPSWRRCGEGERLYSIGMALAQAVQFHSRPRPWLERLLEDPEAHKNLRKAFRRDTSGNDVPCERSFTLVNYAKLELMEHLAVQGNDAKSILSAKTLETKSKFQDKLVIVGNAQRGKATDCFVVVGRHRPVTGSLIHASATYSLVDEPVYKLKHWPVILLDVLLGSVVFVGLFIIRRRHLEDTDFSYYLWESGFILFSIILTVALGFLLVRTFNVIWFDFLLVLIALLLHSHVREGIMWIPRVFFRRKVSK
jgi:CHASE2 domain-containing sensor protein